MKIKPIDLKGVATIQELIEKMEDSCASFPVPISQQIKTQKKNRDNKMTIHFIDLKNEYEITDEYAETLKNMDVSELTKTDLPSNNMDFEIRYLTFDQEDYLRLDGEKEGSF